MVPHGGQIRSLIMAMTSAQRTMRPRFLLFFLLLKIACTSCLSVRSYYDEKFYINGNIRCLRCAAGTYVSQHCTTPDSLGFCAPCQPEYTYSEHLTGLEYCLQCKVCRPDEEEVTPCTVTKNTVCRCKKGTFCPPDGPCEICQKCTTSCPPDLVVQEPCNSTADTQCGSKDTESFKPITILALSISIIISLAAVLCFWYFCYRKNRKEIKLDKCECHKALAGDAVVPFLSRSKLQFRENISENEKNEAICKIFNSFVDVVPKTEFERFVRSLGLTQNEIERAKDDNNTSYDQQYAMLSKLYWDQKFDVNIWLDKLCDNKMKTVAEEVTKRLIEEGLFERIEG